MYTKTAVLATLLASAQAFAPASFNGMCHEIRCTRMYMYMVLLCGSVDDELLFLLKSSNLLPTLFPFNS